VPIGSSNIELLFMADSVEKLWGSATAFGFGGIFKIGGLAPGCVGGRVAAFIGGLCRHRLHGRHSRPQSGETPQVLRGRGEQELVLRAAWTAQSQTPKL